MLCRSAAPALRCAENALTKLGVPCQIAGSNRFFERAPVAAALAHLRLVANELDDDACAKCLAEGCRGLGAKSVEALRRGGGPLLGACRTAAARGTLAPQQTAALRDLLARLDALYDAVASRAASASPVRSALRLLDDVLAPPVDGGVRWWMVGAQIPCQHGLMFLLHYFEHKGPLGPEFYRKSHKPHHRFVNPRLFDAFDGSVPDTFCMILIPLATTAQLLHANVWEYMAFGASWSAWLCLIHSETHHAWDGLFRTLGLGTPADHHVHHVLFVSNYGHLFMYWDMACRTYKSPRNVRQFVPNGKPPRKWEGSAKHE